MAKISLRASGGLNLDVDPNNLPEGDYVDASNILYDAGATGGAGAIKNVESIKEATAVGDLNGTVKATFQSPDGYIYVLVRQDNTTAVVYRLSPALDTAKTAVVTYPHGVTDTAFNPDLKVIGDCIVWNYAGNGIVLIYSMIQGIGATLNVQDLALQKRTPNNHVRVFKDTLNLTAGRPFLESNDVQFAARYQYRSGEYSVLSAYSQMYKAEKGVVQYKLYYFDQDAPFLAETLEVYVRIGNAGTWRRIDSNKIGVDPTTFYWTGQMYESLDSVAATKSFDAIPATAKHIEIAKNRIFLANIVDDNPIVENNLKFTLSVTSSQGYVDPKNEPGTYNSYLDPIAMPDSFIKSTEDEGTMYHKPFANNSEYGIGFAYYDSSMKTRGVEKYVTFSSGKFAYPILPTVDIVLASQWVAPTWARYAQIVYTKNKNKSYFYEGYASNIFFEFTQISTNPTTGAVTEELVLSQSITKDQLKNVKNMVVDLMGMFRANSIYNYTVGDRISINTGTNGILDLKITGQNNNLIYCEYNGSEMSNPTVPNSSVFYFEIYTPKQVQEDESLVFYEQGQLLDITLWGGNSTIKIGGDGSPLAYLNGDTVFQKLELPVYSESPFTKTTTKTSPAEVTLGVQTQANCQINSAYGSGFSIISTSSTAPSDVPYVPYFTSFTTGVNQDGANILDSAGAYASSGPEMALSGYYDIATQLSSNFLTVEHKLLITKNIPFAIPGSCEWAIYAKVMRVPYNNTTNTYGSPVVFIAEEQLYTETVTSTQTNVTYNLNFTQTKTLAAYGTDISANDKFYITYRLTVPLMAGPSSLNINVKKQTSVDNGVIFTVLGSRTAPKITTSYNSDAKVSSTKSKFAVRSISNAVSNQLWNTSAGKPSVQVIKNTTTSSLANRINTIRYGGSYVLGTKVNNLNSFFALDSADVPTENGQINSLQRVSRLQGNGSMLLALCEKEVAYALLGEQELLQGDNSTVVSLSSNVIGTIRNIGYNYGLQDKLSAYNYRGTVWWWDNFNKKILRYTEQGLEIPSDVYMKSFYLTKSGVMRFAYDSFYNMCFAGFAGNTTSMGFSDNRKRWISRYTFRPDFAESFGDKTMMIKDNKVYKTLQYGPGITYNNFFNSPTGEVSSIAFVVNSKVPVQPTRLSIWHNMSINDYSTPNQLKAGLLNIEITNDSGQKTVLNSTNFLEEDRKLYAHVMRDLRTPLTAVPIETLKEQTYTATAGQTTFTVTDGYILGNIDVYINNVQLATTAYTATNGTTVVLNTGATVGSTVKIVNNVDKRLTEGYYIIGYLNKFIVTLEDITQNMRINSIDVELKPVVGHS